MQQQPITCWQLKQMFKQCLHRNKQEFQISDVTIIVFDDTMIQFHDYNALIYFTILQVYKITWAFLFCCFSKNERVNWERLLDVGVVVVYVALKAQLLTRYYTDDFKWQKHWAFMAISVFTITVTMYVHASTCSCIHTHGQPHTHLTSMANFSLLEWNRQRVGKFLWMDWLT